MTSILNKPVPNFSFETTNGLHHTFSDYLGKNIILFFYPKDNTPVCTVEAKAFRDHFESFGQLDTVILGVSKDDLSSHERFKARLCLPFELIADTKKELCEYFGVIKMKSLFGKKIQGIARHTFLIDKEGVVRQEWRKVKVLGHIEEVFAAVNQLE